MRSFKWIIAATLLLTQSLALAQYRNYSLRCLAPLLDNIDPNAPENLQQAFLIGPTHFATLRGGIGREAIEFPISTESAEAAEIFEQGVALLHTLAYKEAEQAFRTVVELDPDCPMGYWGLAQANERLPDHARIYAIAAAEMCDRNRPEIEQRWTALLSKFYTDADQTDLTRRSLDRVKALEELALDFPDHQEIRAFLIRRLTLDPFVTGLPITSTLGVSNLARDFGKNAPTHPSRHYDVFLWMERRPDDVLAEATKMTQLTPGAAEIWRYAATAFLNAGQANAAAQYGEVALRTDHKNLSERNLMPWEAENLFENYEALVTVLTYSGRIDEALGWAKAATLMPRELSATSESPPPGQLWANTLMISEQWERLLQDLESNPFLNASDTPRARAARLEWQGLASLALGQHEEAATAQETLIQLERDSLIAGVSTATEKAIANSRRTLETLLTLFQSDVTTDLEEIQLPQLVKAYFYEFAGRDGPALVQAQKEIEGKPYEWLPTAVYSRLAVKAGRTRDALFRLDRRFRADSSLVDPDLPALSKLALISDQLSLPSSWMVASEKMDASDLAPDPGPLHWSPPEAPAFELVDRLDRSWSLQEFEGKPLLIQFFLGTQCAFCLQQFEAFQPYWPAFGEADIQLLAVSINSLEELKQTLGEAEALDPALQDKFPFPILADPNLEAFKPYGVFDDFESGPMHATVLLSPEGKILWRNISHEPFARPEALLSEAKRLLKAHGFAPKP